MNDSIIVLDSDSDDDDRQTTSSSRSILSAENNKTKDQKNAQTPKLGHNSSSVSANEDFNESIIECVGDDEEEEEEENEESPRNANNSSATQTPKTKRQFEYVMVEEDLNMENEIDSIRKLISLTEKQIEYMVLRDVNYYIDIISGCCEHSWRHQEFKKNSKKSGNFLFENSSLNSYTYDQYTAVVRALQFIFCKKDHRYNEYIVKVLMPEALIKICMRIYQCSKPSAEDFLKNNTLKTPDAYPKGSAIYSPLVASKKAAPAGNKSEMPSKSQDPLNRKMKEKTTLDKVKTL